MKARVYEAVPALIGEHSETPEDDATTVGPVPIPIARQGRSSDPETFANRAGGFIPEHVKPPGAVAMRIVGDQYYFSGTKPGPPSTVAGYVPPEPTDFRVKQETSALEATDRAAARNGDPLLNGSY